LSWYGLWKSRDQCGHAGDIAVVFSGLIRTAEDDIVDDGRIETCPIDDSTDDQCGEIVGANPCQRAAMAPDWRAHGFDDDGVRGSPVSGHFLLSFALAKIDTNSR
jgi:hypothetical protein